MAKYRVPIYDPTSNKCADIMNYLLALLIYVFFSIIPILMLILYPFNFFKTCLSKCKLNPLVLSGFMEKFHSCYKNGNNGKDMRSLSALYFVLTHLIFLHHFLFGGISYWYYQGYLFMIMAVLIGYLKPYKESYMNIFDTFLLTYMSVCCHMLSRIYFGLEEDQFIDMIIILLSIFGLLCVYKVFMIIYSIFRAKYANRSLSTVDDPTEPLLPNIDNYSQEITHYAHD